MHFILKTWAMYTMQHAHLVAQVVATYQRVHSINDDDKNDNSSKA